MKINEKLAVLGGLTPEVFMRKYWQKRPLLVRQAFPCFDPPVGLAHLRQLAASHDVESRCVVKVDGADGEAWQLRHGPFAQRSLPPLKQPGWTLLVQGVDLHNDAVHELMNQFHFIPRARLDDVMVSYASDQGGVGPHFDSYDVFLLQAQGQRRWRIGKQKDLQLQPDVPLKILAHFEPEQEMVLDPGDMLYLPPRYAHDGVALGQCMTYSFGFRASSPGELAEELLQRLAGESQMICGKSIYSDSGQEAVMDCAEIPERLAEFSRRALDQVMQDPDAIRRVLGEHLTEPKPSVFFSACPTPFQLKDVRLDRRTKMLFDARHVFINGESYLATGRDAHVLRILANHRRLSASETRGLSLSARELLHEWAESGWLHATE